MSKIYQIFLTCGLVVTAAPAFAKQDYARLQQQVLANDAILQSLQQSQSAYDVNQQYAGRLNNPTFNLVEFHQVKEQAGSSMGCRLLIATTSRNI